MTCSGVSIGLSSDTVAGFCETLLLFVDILSPGPFSPRDRCEPANDGRADDDSAHDPNVPETREPDRRRKYGTAPVDAWGKCREELAQHITPAWARRGHCSTQSDRVSLSLREGRTDPSVLFQSLAHEDKYGL